MAPRWPQDGPRYPQECAKMVQRPSQDGQASKTASRGTQYCVRRPFDCPSGPRRPPDSHHTDKTAPRRPKSPTSA
eukprot:6401906-Pyramimonas_sp.AAC.2